MKSSLVPALVTPYSTPAATAQVRRDLQQANQELASGRHADLGLTLAGRSSVLMEQRAEEALLAGLRSDVGISEGRLQVAQQSLSMITNGAQELLNSLAPLASGQAAPGQVAVHAAGLLKEFTNAVNATSQGAYVFGGINIAETPLADYFAEPVSAARAAVEGVFAARFGFAPGNAAAVSISAADMADFLDNDFAALFDSPQWETLFSSATDEEMRAPIGMNDTVQATTSANNPAIRKLAMAYVMVAGLGMETLNAEARQALVSRAMSGIGEGIALADGLRGEIGFRQERLARASERLETQGNLLRQSIADMEQVDLHAVAARVNELTVRLETSYKLTARLQELTLLRFL